MRLTIFLTMAFSLLLLFGCKSGGTSDDASAEYYYTCPMHPSVISKTPGACPVCNMSLIKVERNNKQGGDNRKGNYIDIDSRQQTLAGIETDTVWMRQIAATNTVLGTVVIDEEQVKVITSRVKGRIEQLFIKETGVYVQSGKPLYSIYSEQLLADQKEYLVLAEKMKSNGSTSPIVADMLGAAKNKLLLWGLTEKQVSALETTGTSPSVTFFSPEAGYVTEVSVTEGMYVEAGSPLYKITSLKQVWIEAQLYANETTNASKDKAYNIYAGNGADVYQGKLVYSNPIIEKGQKIHLLRIQVDNKNDKLIPGMLVSVGPQKNTQAVLAVPKSAILQEKMKTAWVKTEENTFEQRMVTTGTESQYWVEILSGLEVGDVIVTDGAYLISSEFILKNGAGMRHEH